MIVAHFETTCLNCNNIFSCPQLHDSSYGDIIFNCECGKEFSYHSMVSHPVTLIFDLLCQIYKTDRDNHSLADFSALFADKIHFHHYTAKTICSKCKSENLSVNVNRKTGSWELRTASFEELYALSKEELFLRFQKAFTTNKLA